MGLIVEVFRAAARGDCSMNGISSNHDRLCLVNVEGPFEPDAETAAAMLVEGNLPRTVKIVPCKLEQGKWKPVPGTMMGGNYAATSDSRFSTAAERIIGDRFYGAVAVHDRIEQGYRIEQG